MYRELQGRPIHCQGAMSDKLGDTIRQVAVDLIQPGSQQARRRFDAAAMTELTESVRQSGVVQPVVLRSTHGPRFELLAGERRWRAAQAAGLHTIPAVVRNDLSDQEAFVIGLIENLQRESLAPMDAAHGMQRLGEEFDLTHEQIGARIGKSREYVSNHIRLLTLVPEVAQLLNDGLIQIGHAKVLAGVSRPKQLELGHQVVRDRLTVRTLERRVSSGRNGKMAAAKKAADWASLERELSDLFGATVAVTTTGKGSQSGSLRIDFTSLDELDGILERVGYRKD